MKKTLVLVTLFVLPIVAYLFFLSGTYNFGKLPTLTEQVSDVTDSGNNEVLKGKITILGFMGADVASQKASAFNLNEKIYKRFYEFNDLQFIMLSPKGSEAQMTDLKEELGTFTDVQKWRFIATGEDTIKKVFASLKTDLELDEQLATPYVFIVDKELNLRGRTADEDEGTKYGFNANSVAELNNKMVDDVKIILAEYRLALKKNNLKEKE